MKNFFLICGLLLLFVVPHDTHAYKTTAQSVTQLTETTALYTITYEFGFLNAEAWLPIGTIYSQSSDLQTVDRVQYQISGAETINTAIVLSDMTIKDKMYHVPRGKRGQFTLTALVKRAPSIESFPELKVTQLPLIILSGETTKTMTLAPEQLTEYKAP